VIIVTFLMLILITYSASGAVRAIPQLSNQIFRMSDSWSIQITISVLLLIFSVSFFNPMWVTSQRLYVKILVYVCPLAWMAVLVCWAFIVAL